MRFSRYLHFTLVSVALLGHPQEASLRPQVCRSFFLSRFPSSTVLSLDTSLPLSLSRSLSPSLFSPLSPSLFLPRPPSVQFVFLSICLAPLTPSFSLLCFCVAPLDQSSFLFVLSLSLTPSFSIADPRNPYLSRSPLQLSVIATLLLYLRATIFFFCW